MKRVLFISVLFLATQIALSQVVVLNYMNVPPNGGERYETVEKRVKNVMQELVDRGEMLDWELYRVHNQGSQSPYQYVTVDVYKDFPSSLKGMNWEVVQEVLGDETGQVFEEVMASRELIYRETLGLNMGLPTQGDDKFLLISYMKASNPDKYYEMEQTAFLPMHQIAIDKGEMVGWSVWTPLLFDEKSDYTALTVNGYSSIDQVGATNYGALYKEFSAGKSDKELSEIQVWFDNMAKIRTIAKAQVWEKVLETETSDD
jgi:hypothetical protein